ncbi:MAG: xanthine dehydrogenase family protein molybdopterin-binding subunit [SAR202 cluster bacterium]|nr:xanthine dehydrogenase family protein molybdopterin-binding subunit [SAR202 cluster bacterium]
MLSYVAVAHKRRDMISYNVIGQPIVRSDGFEKVTGRAQYTGDLKLPGMLWGKVLRSPFAHARIIRVDTSRAVGLPGVHAVLTGDDTRGVRYGRRLFDVPPLAEERVLFAGERVAAVAAESMEIAQNAIDLIEVEYDPLPAIADPLESMKGDAFLLHPDVNDYVGLPKKLEKVSNVFVTNTWGKGELDTGFAQADHILERTYTTPLVHQAYLEPHSCVVFIDEDQRIQIWAANKAPFALRQQLAAAIGVDEDRIRLNPTYIGGDFGGKGSPMDVPLVYFLALHSKRPVRMVMDYVEEFTAANPRHPSVTTVRSGVLNDGTLTAWEARIIFNSGAYGGFKPGVNLGGARDVAGPYKIPHTFVEAIQVYTNSVPGGHMRGPGEPQGIFAGESHLDEIARILGIDPLEFRLKNLVGEGDVTATGSLYRDVKAKETLEAASMAARYGSPLAMNVGRGMAMGARAPGGGETHVGVIFQKDGTVVARTPILDQGTGTYTTVNQVVAEELGLSSDKVQIIPWNTDAVSFDTGIGGSRGTRVASQAAYAAAQNAKQELLRAASEIRGWDPSNLVLKDNKVYKGNTEDYIDFDFVVQNCGFDIQGTSGIEDREQLTVTAFCAQIAEVAVDVETGQIKLLRFTSAHDVGQVLNPIGHQGQINGGVVQGIGYALMEELEVEDGRVSNVTFGDYKIPTMADIPELRTVLVQSKNGVGPYNIKGIGENTNTAVAAAIANAVEDAIGVRVYSLPITAEKVLAALRESNV